MVDLSGEKHGQASLLKLMGNVLIMTTMETVAEVNVFAEKTGLGTQNMEKLMNQLFPQPPHAIYNKKILNGDYYQKEVCAVQASDFIFKPV
jgi:3-hydroxyisobutyrate dehydrogenase-like beta-hydroxyacid dehydrogenase